MAKTVSGADAKKTKPRAKNPAKAAAKASRNPAPYDTPLFAGGETEPDAQNIVAAADKAQKLLADAQANVNKIILGQKNVVEQVLTALLAGGHALLIGVPGLAKTKLAESLGIILGLDEKRIQFTPDLMPADILGSEVLEQSAAGKRSFRYIEGPVFTQLLMADEINRASPRTQAALLQAMQEYHVTVAGKTYNLPRPFHVIATQNPLEQEGTYSLPEAQLDRFLMQITLPYPDYETEKSIVLATTGLDEAKPQQALNAERLIEMQQLVRAMPMPENVLNAIVELVRACRPVLNAAGEISDEYNAGAVQNNANSKDLRRYISWGPGPRAAQALALCARARALLQGRLAPALTDIRALALPVLQHRMALSFAAKADNVSLETIINHAADEAVKGQA